MAHTHAFVPSRADALRAAARLALLLCLLSAARPAAEARASRQQSGQTVAEMEQKVGELIKKQQYTDALPLLERLVIAKPDKAEIRFHLGFALLAQANNTKDAGGKKALSLRARASFVKAKELGMTEPLVDALIASIPPEGSAGQSFSKNPRANELMTEAEGFFSRGKLDEALVDYQKALQLDPNIYEAALFSGDVYVQRGDFQNAEVWYQKAIGINPTRETAYRYSATPLMKQRKFDAARDRYVEAFITEPYNRYTTSGLSQWAQATNTRLSHPAIDIPTNVTYDEKGDPNIGLDAGALLGASKEDGSFAWLTYGVTRSAWHKGKFAETFPQEKQYRHSLPEEAAALRAVLALAAGDKDTKKLSPSLAKLKKLDDEGLLEAYVLLARPDEGIARDHPAYLKQNRDKLRRYVVEYVTTGGGN
ncbi:MAG TPA: tetratricopeptide repeat protein [Pyrinomonadaceae bacterium]|nr:tetratricopeptide repeat protein [Pyrinomonadaceae bacterium]